MRVQIVHVPLSDEDLKAIRSVVRDELVAVEQQFDTKLEALEARMQEFMRDIETNMLTAFHGYAKGQTA
jgi:hypothetical protein